jgi:mRNA-degrading endonuclease RelE of RelBE toxin-antitoxin system
MPNDTPENIQLQFTTTFKKNLKQLAKRYRHVKSDLEPLLNDLQKGLLPGDRIPDIGEAVYKVRLLNSDIQKGKSAGYRVIYYVLTAQDQRLLLTIYSKSDQASMLPSEIKALIESENEAVESSDAPSEDRSENEAL